MLTKTQLYKIGTFDNASRFTLNPKFETETSAMIRTPSRSWPFTVWNHCQTKKFYQSLSVSQLELI